MGGYGYLDWHRRVTCQVKTFKNGWTKVPCILFIVLLLTAILTYTNRGSRAMVSYWSWNASMERGVGDQTGWLPALHQILWYDVTYLDGCTGRLHIVIHRSGKKSIRPQEVTNVQGNGELCKEFANFRRLRASPPRWKGAVRAHGRIPEQAWEYNGIYGTCHWYLWHLSRSWLDHKEWSYQFSRSFTVILPCTSASLGYTVYRMNEYRMTQEPDSEHLERRAPRG